MTDILTDLDILWDSIVKEAKRPDIELDTKISIFDKGLKYASIKYKVQPDEIEGRAWNDYARKLKGNDSGRESSGDASKEGQKAESTVASGGAGFYSPKNGGKRPSGNGHA